LLRALLRLRERGVDFEMQVVGEDTLRGEIQALAARLGLSAAVTFHGFLPQQRLRPLLEASDVMLISSRHANWRKRNLYLSSLISTVSMSILKRVAHTPVLTVALTCKYPEPWY